MGINIDAVKGAKSLTVEFADVENTVNGEAEKDLRKRLGLTQSTMAGLLHVSTKTIEKWEEGGNPIVGGDATLIYLLMNEPTLARRLLRVTPNNGFVVPQQYEAFVECKDGNKKPISLEFTDPVFQFPDKKKETYTVHQPFVMEAHTNGR
jgi:DNA-binding transcriptional regulator YiaG